MAPSDPPGCTPRDPDGAASPQRSLLDHVGGPADAGPSAPAATGEARTPLPAVQHPALQPAPSAAEQKSLQPVPAAPADLQRSLGTAFDLAAAQQPELEQLDEPAAALSSSDSDGEVGASSSSEASAFDDVDDQGYDGVDADGCPEDYVDAALESLVDAPGSPSLNGHRRPEGSPMQVDSDRQLFLSFLCKLLFTASI